MAIRSAKKKKNKQKLAITSANTKNNIKWLNICQQYQYKPNNIQGQTNTVTPYCVGNCFR